MDISPYKTADSSHNLISRTGLAALAKPIAKLKLRETLNQTMLVAGSNRGYTASALFNTFTRLLHEGGSYLIHVHFVQRC